MAITGTTTVLAACALLLVILLAWRGRGRGRGRKREGLQPEASVLLDWNDTRIRARYPEGRVVTVRWDELLSVRIRTTDEGPWRPDVFWVLADVDGVVLIAPQGGDRRGWLSGGAGTAPARLRRSRSDGGDGLDQQCAFHPVATYGVTGYLVAQLQAEFVLTLSIAASARRRTVTANFAMVTVLRYACYEYVAWWNSA